MSFTKRTVHGLLGVAALSGLSLAQAQSNVAVSGTLDAGVFSTGSGTTQVGTIQRSHLQFAGTEDLGNGLAATFKLRTRLDLDTGAIEGNGSKPFWHGESTVGLKGGFGALRIGRAQDAIQSQDWAFDPWEFNDRVASPAWDLWHWNYSADPHGGGSGRVANSLFYNSPKYANLGLNVSYSPEQQPGDVAKTRAASLVYNDGTYRAMLGSAHNSADATETSVGLRADINAWSVMGLYNISKSNSASTAKVITLGGAYTFGATTLKAGWGRVSVDGAEKERLVSTSASYALSKRTAVYVDLAGKHFASSGNKTAYGVGIVHNF